MNPESRTSWALGASLAMWSPVAFSILGGGVDILRGGLLYVAALLIAWFGTGVIMSIANNYRSMANEVERAKREIEMIEERNELERVKQLRRETDPK